MQINAVARLALALALLSGAASAQAVVSCDNTASAFNLVEPWDQNSRTFANGEVRVALLDTVEPAAAAFHLLMISPPRDELGLRQCRTVSMSEGSGFAGLDFAALTASYDPATGLVLELPAKVFDATTAELSPRMLTVTLNQTSGEIVPRLDPARE